MANHADIDPYAPPLASLDVEQVVEGTESLAGQGQRLGAHWLDNIVLVAPCIAVAGLFAALGLFEKMGATEPLIIAAAIIPGAAVGIYQCYLVTTTGQSLGKRWLKIKIVKTDGRPVGFMDGVVWRTWTVYGAIIVVSALSNQQLGNVVFWFDVLFIFGSQRRTLHDRIAGTKVISVALRV